MMKCSFSRPRLTVLTRLAASNISEVLRGGLPGHVQVFAKLAERLPVLLTKKVKQLSACRVAQRFENLVSVHRSHSYVRTQYAGKYLHVNWQLGRRPGRLDQ